ncbi:MAG TPA: acyl-CoA dehydrogenase [Syntrophales bacterium]|nr:acyl-CoA dehydrogenase [Syntrophales bacterium]
MGTNFFKRNDRDIKFVLEEHLKIQELLNFNKFKSFSMDDFSMILGQALKVATEVLGPTNKDGDQQGVTFDQGKVRVPASFHGAWKTITENGWGALSLNSNYGGQELPHVVAQAAKEYFSGANLAFWTYVGLATGNGRLIELYGTEKDRALFVRNMYNGVWGGTMCLTEPGAGSDVGNLTTKAIPRPDSAVSRIYNISGSKIFITAGDHDLTENIVHLVLARVEGAPEGVRGISLFVVPKIWVNDDGTLGEHNDVITSGVEHKMGIHGSPTCVLNFGDNGKCRGILLGDVNTGLAKMFTMMNESRLETALEALAISACAYENSLDYAKIRVQGVPFMAGKDGKRVRIIEHEDVRRMLMNMKSVVEGMRALMFKTYYLLDVSLYGNDEKAKKAAGGLVELFVPFCKAYFSDMAYLICRDAIQIHGGYGYCGEYPVEQYARDCKIITIWEGTNYIQSLDLVGRKLNMAKGMIFFGWMQDVMSFVEKNTGNKAFEVDLNLLKEAAKSVQAIVEFQRSLSGEERGLIPLYSTRFLDCCAEVAIAHLLLEQALIAQDKMRKLGDDHVDGAFYKGKVFTAQYYVRNIMINVFSREKAIKLADRSAMEIPEEGL